MHIEEKQSNHFQHYCFESVETRYEKNKQVSPSGTIKRQCDSIAITTQLNLFKGNRRLPKLLKVLHKEAREELLIPTLA